MRLLLLIWNVVMMDLVSTSLVQHQNSIIQLCWQMSSRRSYQDWVYKFASRLAAFYYVSKRGSKTNILGEKIMSVKINVAKELGIKKSFEVKESNKNIRKTWQLQKLMTKLSIDQELADSDNPEKAEEMIDMMLDVQTKVIEYVVDVLNLTDAQADKVDDLSFDETVQLATRISSELLHVETVEATEEEAGLEA
ncbi:hypothetical protein EFN57_04640 [Leuconostoc citreum]|nr:hypothetical protein [Leuconostoc citreum]MCT3062272.1 hypothetical protein [Leuconostoc citreum]